MRKVNDPDQVIRTDRWSRYQWQRFLEASPEAAAVVERGAAKVYSAPRFVRELFQTLYGDHAERVEPLRPEDGWAGTAHDELAAMPDFERLRRRCRGDRLFAGTAAVTFAEKVFEKLPEPQRPLQDPEPLREQVRGLMAFARSLSGHGHADADVQNAVGDLRRQGQEAVDQAAAFAKAIDPTELRQALRAGCEAGHEAVDEVTTTLGAFCGWGTSTSMNGDNVSAEVKARLAHQIQSSSKLQQLAREAGRLRRIAAAKQRSKADLVRNEVADLERGNDLGRLLPSELVKLTDPALALDFARGFFEKSLLQYRLSGKETQGRGPIVVCIDQSSSMEGQKEIWSKAIALALLQVACMQKRACRVIHFNSAVVRVDDWKPGKVEPMALIKSLEPFYGGGTDFEPPLAKAMEAISAEPKLRKADVVLITDGDANLSAGFADEWARARKRHEVTCYAVHVDAPGGVPPPQLQAVADRTIGLADVATDAAATDVLLSI